MNKKLLAAAISAAVVGAPAAFAESTVYGKLHTSIDANDFEDTADNYSMESRASRLGFKGSEDLGNGLKAIYQLEFSVQTDGNDGGVGQDGGDGWGGQRNTFIGLSGGFGTFLVGRHDTPAKVAFYATGNDRLGDSVIDLNSANSLTPSPASAGGSPIGVFSEYRADNAIAYISPNFSGFTVAAAIIPGEDSGIKSAGTPSSPASFSTVTVYTTPTTGALTSKLFLLNPATAATPGSKNDRDGLADHWSVGLMYSGNGLKAGLGYAKYDSGSVEQKMTQVGASYTMNNFSVGAQYEKTKDFAFVKDQDYKAWAVTGKATFGNNAVSLVYTDGTIDPSGGNNDTDVGGWGVAAEHNFSKRTTAYVAYADGEVDEDGASKIDNSVFSLGMIHNF